MRDMLTEIQNGTYARTWIAENAAGRPTFEARRRSEQEHEIERVGARLRAMMPFLDPVTVLPQEQNAPVGPSALN
jgi:ketol-acid reductoisomerase